jgi:L-rhamnose mutarotase/predicted nucleotidyltransferase
MNDRQQKMADRPYTPYPDVNQMLDRILAGTQKVLGSKLVGLYLYGSLVAGDFDLNISDIDLLAAVSDDIDEADFAALKQMHDDLVQNDRHWNNRLEIVYLSLHALKTFKTQTSRIAITSPGEPFHFKEAGNDYLMNWYIVREKGLTLFGPPPQVIIDPMSKEDFIEAVKGHLREWPEYIHEMQHLGGQAYAILTMCRALYIYRNGEQVSKRQAALWAQQDLPEWSSLIANALVWRTDYRASSVDPMATFPETSRFVYFVVNQIVG